MLRSVSFRVATHCRGGVTFGSGVLRTTPCFTRMHYNSQFSSRFLSTCATPEATTEFLAKYPTLPTSIIPKRDLKVSKLGFGSYRINGSQPAHRAALLKAIQSGVNVIDTSSHFGHGASEAAIGDILEELINQNKIRREDIVVVSKAGFIIPPDPTNVASFSESLGGILSLAKISDSSFHSIHPTYLESQITASLERLKLKKLDIFMLNNPERMLGDKFIPGGFSKSRLYKEIGEAFAYLDREVANGRIGGYGICSNALHIPTAEDHLSLKAIAKTRAEFGWNLDNFIAIQAPLNLFERELVTDSFPAKSLAREAKEFNIFVFTNRPLNAIANGQIITLENKDQHNRRETAAKLLDTLGLSFNSLAQMELDIKDIIDDETIAMKFVWSEILSENLSRLSANYFAAKHYLEREVSPAIDRDLKILEASVADYSPQEIDGEYIDKDAILNWIELYRKEAKTLTKDIAAFCQLDADKRNDELDAVLRLICNEFVTDVGPNKVKNIGSLLSTKSIQFCTAQPNIGCTLVGMREPDYVYDALAATKASTRLSQKHLDDIAQCPLLLPTTAE